MDVFITLTLILHLSWFKYHITIHLLHSNTKDACKELTGDVGNNSCNRSAGCNYCDVGKFTAAYSYCLVVLSNTILISASSSYACSIFILDVPDNQCNGGKNDVCPDSCDL